MEGQPKSSAIERGHNGESLSDWRERKERAPEEAEKFISEIDGFENLTSGKKVLALNLLKEELASDNKNLYIDRILAKKVADIMDSMTDDERRKNELPLRSPNEERPESVRTPFPEVPPEKYIQRLGYVPGQSPDHSAVDAELPRAA